METFLYGQIGHHVQNSVDLELGRGPDHVITQLHPDEDHHVEVLFLSKRHVILESVNQVSLNNVTLKDK